MVHEEFCFDLETYVYDCPESYKLEPLVEDGIAEIITSADELAATLGGGTVGFERERIFWLDATDRIETVLERLQRQGCAYWDGSTEGKYIDPNTLH
jgi:hypothetical protein